MDVQKNKKNGGLIKNLALIGSSVVLLNMGLANKISDSYLNSALFQNQNHQSKPEYELCEIPYWVRVFDPRESLGLTMEQYEKLRQVDEDKNQEYIFSPMCNFNPIDNSMVYFGPIEVDDENNITYREQF